MTHYQSLIDLFNQMCPSLPRVGELTNTRKRKIKCRLQEHPDLDWWKDVFGRVNLSPFLRGEKKWRGARFDWLIENDNNAVKVYEGHYDGDGDYLSAYE